jgi:hypothetical protein
VCGVLQALALEPALLILYAANLITLIESHRLSTGCWVYRFAHTSRLVVPVFKLPTVRNLAFLIAKQMYRQTVERHWPVFETFFTVLGLLRRARSLQRCLEMHERVSGASVTPFIGAIGSA